MLRLAQRHVNRIEELVLRHERTRLVIVETLYDLDLERLERQYDVILQMHHVLLQNRLDHRQSRVSSHEIRRARYVSHYVVRRIERRLELI